MASTNYKRLAYAESEWQTIKTVYTAPNSGSVVISTITLVSFEPQTSTYVNIYVNGVLLFNSLLVNPIESPTLVLDNLGIALSPGGTIAVKSAPGPNVFVSVFGATSYQNVVSESIVDPIGVLYEVPSDKDFICNAIAISNNSATSAVVEISALDDPYVTENVFAFLPQNQQKLYKTEDFNSWTTSDLPAATWQSSSISYINGTYIFFSTPTKKVYISTDLISWTNVYTITQSNTGIQAVLNVSYGNGIYAINFYGPNNLLVLHTSDFVSWTLSDYGWAFYKPLFMYEPTSLNAFVRMSGNYIWKSYDLVTWSNTGIYAPGEMSSLQNRQPILNKYYGFFDSGSWSVNRLYRYDFLNINQYGHMDDTVIDLPPVTELSGLTRVFKSIAYGNGVGVIIAKDAINDDTDEFVPQLSTGYVSSDMENWTAVTIPAVPHKSDVIFSNGLFAFSYYQATSWFVSSDGITWQMKANGPRFDYDLASSSLSYSETVEAIPATSDIISKISIDPSQSVLIKSGYTLSSNSGIIVTSNGNDIGVGIYGVEV